MGGGRYSGSSPLSVAKKVAELLLEKSNKNTVSFCLRETTRNSKKKLYNYVGYWKKGKVCVRVNKRKVRGGNAKIVILQNKTNQKYLTYNENDQIEEKDIYYEKDAKYHWTIEEDTDDNVIITPFYLQDKYLSITKNDEKDEYILSKSKLSINKTHFEKMINVIQDERSKRSS